jgi:hypothetical protein
MKRILLGLAVALLTAMMVAMALPAFAAAQGFPGCKSHSFESKCNQEFFEEIIGEEIAPQANFGDRQSRVATREGGKAAGASHIYNPSFNDGEFETGCGAAPGGPPC